MIKKSFIQSIADKNAKVNALCEYLGTLRTECIRNYQTEECANSYSEMHEIYMQVSELSAKLDTLIKENVLSDETTKNQNYESIRNLVISVDNNGKHKGAFVSYFETQPKKLLPFVYSVSECSGYVTKLYNEYLSTLESVRKERGRRERLADKKARLLAELAALEESEKESEKESE
jgi:hypothetical protein